MIISTKKINHNAFLLNDTVEAHYVFDDGKIITTLDFNEKLINKKQAKELADEFLILLLQLKEES